MDYRRIYSQLMKKRLKEPSTQQYIERHHILPRSIHQNSNIIILSARQHFIAHALLVKITQKSQNKENYYKMVYAFNNMNRNSCNSRYINSHLYQLMKCRYSSVRKQLIQQYNPTKDKIWITNLELKISKLISKEQQLPQGWLIGRVTNFNSYLKKYYDALNEQKRYHFLNYQQDIKKILYLKSNFIKVIKEWEI